MALAHRLSLALLLPPLRCPRFHLLRFRNRTRNICMVDSVRPCAGGYPYSGGVKEVGVGAGRGATINLPLPGNAGALPLRHGAECGPMLVHTTGLPMI